MLNDIDQAKCRNVYVVDDDEVVLRSTEAVLGQSGYNVKCFASARQVLDEAPLYSCGCLIADVQMPEMTGVELIRQLSAAGSTLAVIAISGVADVATTVSVMQYGAATLIEKPYDSAELLQAVNGALARSCESWKHYNTECSLRERLARLSVEEHAVMQLMLRDEPNKAIANELGLSLRTVDRRRQAVLAKMQVKSIPALAAQLGAAHIASEGKIDIAAI